MTDLQIKQANDVLQFVAGQNELCTRDDIRIYMTESCGYGINDILFAIGILCQYNLIENYQNRKLVFMITPEGMTTAKVGLANHLNKQNKNQVRSEKERKVAYQASKVTIMSFVCTVVGIIIGLIVALINGDFVEWLRKFIGL